MVLSSALIPPTIPPTIAPTFTFFFVLNSVDGIDTVTDGEPTVTEGKVYDGSEKVNEEPAPPAVAVAPEATVAEMSGVPLAAAASAA